MERVEARLIHFCEGHHIVPFKGFLWVMVDDLAVKLECSHESIFEQVCGWFLASPFESHPDHAYEQIGLRIIEWWNGLCYGEPVNRNVDDPRRRNYRQAIDPDVLAAIFKPKS